MDPYPFNTAGGYPPPIGPPAASPHLPYQTGVGAQQSYPPMPMNTSMMAPPTSSLPPPPMPPFQQQQQLTSTSMPMMGYNQSYSQQQQPQSQSMVPGPMMMGGMGTVRGGTYPQTGTMAPPPQTTSTTTTTKTTYYAANASQNFSGAVPSTVNRNMPLPGFPQQQPYQQNSQSGGYPQQYYK